MQRGDHCEVVAIASRDLAKAQTTAKQLGIAKAYSSYDELLADPAVDAIYNPLPNHLHVSWSIKALKAGKHVLCEKPIGLTVQEAQQLVAAAARYPALKLMEAFMYRHHPQWQRARQIAQQGGVGTLRTIQSFFSYFNDDAQDIRNQADMGGGGLMDIGCYPISLSRFLFDAEPQRVFGTAEPDPRFGTDRLTSAILQFASGTSCFTCSTQLAPYQRVNIFGDRGRVEIEIPFNAPTDRPCRLWHQRDAQLEEITVPICDQYTIQGDLFAEAILQERCVPTPIGDAVANMRTIEAIFRSADSGRWEDVAQDS
jgi:predicted dehydrogenase